MTPFLSVVIPTLNEEKFLPHLLSDLNEQSEKNFEVIVVDGNSEDKSREVCKEFNKLNIQIYTSNKRNVSTQRNIGAKKAKGAYIFFIDADSRINHSFLSDLCNLLEKEKSLIVIPASVPDMNHPTEQIYLKLSNIAVELSQFTVKPFSNGGIFIFERHFFHHIGGFNESLYLSEDHEIIQRAKKVGVSARYVRDLVFTFSMRRFRQDGAFDMLSKYSLTFIYTLAKGGVDKKFFEYEMGGERYTKQEYKKKLIEFKKLYKQLFGSVEDLM
ncbi:MAG: glycosyltransferase [bacterium]|nr:glycosyltransferase [bacterium]